MPHCPACSAEVGSESRFCGACGAEVRADATATMDSGQESVAATSSLDRARFTAGTLLAGRYRIIGLPGKGGMGEVYRAEDLKLGQLVVLGLSFTAPRPQDGPAWFLLLGQLGFVLTAGAVVFCMLRFGLLSVIGGMTLTDIIGSAPMTLDFTRWYAGTGLIVAAAVLALAIWAFSSALAGQKLFRDSVLD